MRDLKKKERKALELISKMLSEDVLFNIEPISYDQ